MLDREIIQATAARLDEAERTGTQIPQISQANPDMTIEDAYAIQHAWLALKQTQGRIVKGHKIGLTSRAMQQAVNITEPDYGFLLDDMFLEDGVEIPADSLIAPRVEVELAFVLKRRLTGPGCTICDVLNATDFIVPAMEILDARIERVDPKTGRIRTVLDTISDNAANAALVTGGRLFRPLDADLRWISALCYRNGHVEESGVAAAVLNHPARGVAWLADRLTPYGVALEAGETVLAGSFIRPVDARRGDTFHADYGPFGSISCRFV
jgi:2-oxo-hept-3-ene-1,7-dioate hydratase